jgi:uncharacterized membrane protein (UPF0182 family)
LYRRQAGRNADDRQSLWPVATISLTLGVVVGADALLEVFRRLYSDYGVTAGPGWTDVRVRLPAYLILAFVSVAVGAAPLVGALRRRATQLAPRTAP